ncbi:TIGR04222 domain-containing membrane protein [Streptomyces xanthophaeus]
MGWVFRWMVRGSGETRTLDVYDVAFLAGGARRVVDSAVIALNRRGLLVVHASQVRTVDGKQPLHAVERAVVAFCGRTKSIDTIRAGLQRSPEVEGIARGLAAWGLVTGADRQVTRAGRRHLQQAECDPNMPAFVFVESTLLREGAVRRPVGRAQAAPVRRGRPPRRTGSRPYGDSGPGPDTGTHSGGGHSCGGGDGGGAGGGGGGGGE